MRATRKKLLSAHAQHSIIKKLFLEAFVIALFTTVVARLVFFLKLFLLCNILKIFLIAAKKKNINKNV
jgi:hypothetical protein